MDTQPTLAPTRTLLRESGDHQPLGNGEPRETRPVGGGSGVALGADGSRDQSTDSPPPALIQARLRRSRIIPRVVQVSCPAGHADAGATCYSFPPGVCWQRVIARAARP